MCEVIDKDLYDSHVVGIHFDVHKKLITIYGGSDDITIM